jgi:hypothetical protein
VKAVDDGLGLLRRGEDSLAGQIDVHVVEHEGTLARAARPSVAATMAPA